MVVYHELRTHADAEEVDGVGRAAVADGNQVIGGKASALNGTGRSDQAHHRTVRTSDGLGSSQFKIAPGPDPRPI